MRMERHEHAGEPESGLERPGERDGDATTAPAAAVPTNHRPGRRRAIAAILVACLPPLVALCGVFADGYAVIVAPLLALPLCILTAPVAIGLGASAITKGERSLGRAAVFAGVCDVGAPLTIIVLFYAL